MMRGILFLAVALIGVVLNQRADAYTVDEFGLGETPCFTWSMNSWNADHNEYGQWVFGFIVGQEALEASALNQNVQVGMDEPSVINWMDGYCEENSMSTLLEATNALMQGRLQN